MPVSSATHREPDLVGVGARRQHHLGCVFQVHDLAAAVFANFCAAEAGARMATRAQARTRERAVAYPSARWRRRRTAHGAWHVEEVVDALVVDLDVRAPAFVLQAVVLSRRSHGRGRQAASGKSARAWAVTDRGCTLRCSLAIWAKRYSRVRGSKPRRSSSEDPASIFGPCIVYVFPAPVWPLRKRAGAPGSAPRRGRGQCCVSRAFANAFLGARALGRRQAPY